MDTEGRVRKMRLARRIRVRMRNPSDKRNTAIAAIGKSGPGNDGCWLRVRKKETFVPTARMYLHFIIIRRVQI